VLLHRTYIQLHNCKSITINTFHQRSSTSLLFPSLLNTSLHCTVLHFPKIRFPISLPHSFGLFFTTLQNPFSSLIITFLLTNNMLFTAELRWRLFSHSVPHFEYSIYKEVFTYVCSLFPCPNFTIMIIPTQVAWSF